VREVEVDTDTGYIDERRPVRDADLKSLRGAAGLRELDARYGAEITDTGTRLVAEEELGQRRLRWVAPSVTALGRAVTRD
jgi:hypothetical protein